MNKIAITSTIFSNQEQVYNLFTKKGALIFDADIYAKILLKDKEVRQEICNTFLWDPFYDGDIKNIDIDGEGFVTIMNILKPRLLDKYIDLSANRTKPVLFKMDSLFELNFDQNFDKVIFVEMNDELIAENMVKKGYSYLQSKTILDSLYNVNKKRNLATEVIRNNTRQQNMQKIVNQLYNIIK